MSTPAATDVNLQELALEYIDYSHELLTCDPSASEYALEDFIAIQDWGEQLQARAKRLGFSWEQVEEAAE